MNSELTTEKPSWLELPEEDKLRHTYWTNSGKDVPGSFWSRLFRRDSEPRWRGAYHSKEDAEAAAAGTPNTYWIWDGEPARPTTLQKMMFRARAGGDKGVVIEGFQNGEWVALKRYPAGEPLGDQE